MFAKRKGRCLQDNRTLHRSTVTRIDNRTIDLVSFYLFNKSAVGIYSKDFKLLFRFFKEGAGSGHLV